MNIHLVSIRKLNCLSFSFPIALEKMSVIISPHFMIGLEDSAFLDH